VTFQYRRYASAETCEFCGESPVEYEINDLQNKELLYRCASCFEKMRGRFKNAVWKEMP
jgi:predicted SprT family Zn-dependent metalloprotease